MKQHKKTLCQLIEEYAHGEEIDGVVVGYINGRETPGWHEAQAVEDGELTPDISIGELMTWKELSNSILGNDPGFMQGWMCRAFYAWTTFRVIFIEYYDGNFDIQSVPRNPVSCFPNMFGGG